MYPLNDTIAAIATPPGEGAIAVIRVSGPGAIRITDGLFHGRCRLADAATHTLHHGGIMDEESRIVDDVLAAVFRAPASYTGEDVVEISCHGGMFVTREILARILAAGARAALPGEFTRRAFLNGKMDLAQAEAVAEVIRSRSARSLRISLDHLRGDLSERVNALRSEIVAISAQFELELDFSEEGLEIIDRREYRQRLTEISERIGALLSTFRSGRLWSEGVRVGIIGKPNVGKSSLMNKLLQSDRAIVTDTPGTTRDTITESIELGGVVFQLTDTAGIREVSDVVEQEGIRRSTDVVNTSDVLVVMHDAAQVLARGIDKTFMSEARQERINVINKIDLVSGEAKALLRQLGEVMISAKTGEGLGELKARLEKFCLQEAAAGSGEHVMVTKLRHARALEEAQVYIISSIQCVESGAGNELISVNLQRVSHLLAEITGGISTDEILDQVFATFCIGK